jgi:hypothetical protein
MCPLGEIATLAAGGLVGVLIMLKLCWRYVKARFVKTDCGCNCCKHEAPQMRLPESDWVGNALGMPHDPDCKIIHYGTCKNPTQKYDTKT